MLISLEKRVLNENKKIKEPRNERVRHSRFLMGMPMMS